MGLAAEAGDCGLEFGKPVLTTGDEEEMGSLTGEGQGGRPADAARSAGDDDGFVGDRLSHGFLREPRSGDSSLSHRL